MKLLKKSCAIVGLQVEKGEKEEQIAKKAVISKCNARKLFKQNKEALVLSQNRTI